MLTVIEERKAAQAEARERERQERLKLAGQPVSSPRRGAIVAGRMRCPKCDEPQAVNRKGYFLPHTTGSGSACDNTAYAVGWVKQDRKRRKEAMNPTTASIRIVEGGAPGLGRKR